ncbi:MAG: uroporphyrinogen-III synthase [Chloroflexota bacterium]
MDKRLILDKRIVVTRAEEQASNLVERLEELGTIPIVCPAITIVPLNDYTAFDTALKQLSEYDWLLFTSVNGVEVVFERMTKLGIDPNLSHLKIGSIGPATADALTQRGAKVDFVPSAYVAEAILDEIGDVLGQRMLLPRADIARQTLADGLRQKGAFVDAVDAYRTVPGPGAKELIELLQERKVDAITFTSSSTVRFLLDGMDQQGVSRSEARKMLQEIIVICIGPITAATAEAESLLVHSVADTYTMDGLIDALLRQFCHPTAT